MALSSSPPPLRSTAGLAGRVRPARDGCSSSSAPIASQVTRITPLCARQACPPLPSRWVGRACRMAYG